MLRKIESWLQTATTVLNIVSLAYTQVLNKLEPLTMRAEKAQVQDDTEQDTTDDASQRNSGLA